MSAEAWKSCYSCRDYAEHRRDALAEPLADKAIREGRPVVEVVDEFMMAAHDRHLAGTSLRPGGPTRVIDPALGRVAALLSPGLFGPDQKPGPPGAINVVVHQSKPEPPAPVHPCKLGQHRWAWLADGGQACGYCGRPR